MSSINNTDDGDDFLASLCKWTNNTVVHGDGTIDRKWITFFKSHNNYYKYWFVFLHNGIDEIECKV